MIKWLRYSLTFQANKDILEFICKSRYFEIFWIRFYNFHTIDESTHFSWGVWYTYETIDNQYTQVCFSFCQLADGLAPNRSKF